MAIAKNPQLADPVVLNRKADAFISGAGKSSKEGKIPVMIKIPAEALARIDGTAKRLGLNRTAFIIGAAMREVERD